MTASLAIEASDATWREGARSTTAWLRPVLTVVIVALAYRHSLAESVDGLTYDTPLAFTGLVPLLSLGACVIAGRPRPGEHRLPDPDVDWLLAAPLLAGCLVVAWWLPGAASYDFWLNRLDLLGLPLFALAVVALVLGARMARRLLAPLCGLFLLWPYPYRSSVQELIDVTTFVTRWGLGLVAPLLPSISFDGGDRLTINGPGGPFDAVVASACSGANGTAGFLVIGGFLTGALRGTGRRKLAWLAAGSALTVAINVVRICAVAQAGAWWGQGVAMQRVHPFAGLVGLVAGTGLMVAGLPLFGLTLGVATAGPAVAPTRMARHRRDAPSARALAITLALVVLVPANARLRALTGFDGDGRTWPSLIAAPPDAFEGAPHLVVDEVPWVSQYLGAGAEWHRMVYDEPGPTGDAALFVDVQRARSLAAFREFGLEACYVYHGVEVRHTGLADVGSPAPAQTFVYDDGRAWALVSWVWPVDTASGLAYERVVLRTEAGSGGEVALLEDLIERAARFRALVGGAAPVARPEA